MKIRLYVLHKDVRQEKFDTLSDLAKEDILFSADEITNYHLEIPEDRLGRLTIKGKALYNLNEDDFKSSDIKKRVDEVLENKLVFDNVWGQIPEEYFEQVKNLILSKYPTIDLRKDSLNDNLTNISKTSRQNRKKLSLWRHDDKVSSYRTVIVEIVGTSYSTLIIMEKAFIHYLQEDEAFEMIIKHHPYIDRAIFYYDSEFGEPDIPITPTVEKIENNTQIFDANPPLVVPAVVNTAPTEETKKEENINKNIEDGVFVWIETQGTGHVLLTIHQKINPKITMFSYGRYDDIYPNTLGTKGEGVLLKVSDEESFNYLKEQLYKKNAQVFKIKDANKEKVFNSLNSNWDLSKDYPNLETTGELAKTFGKVIDTYDLFENNCTTQIIEALKKADSKIFELSIDFGSKFKFDIAEIEKGFKIPLSLKKYLDEEILIGNQNILNVTEDIKKYLINSENIKEKKLSKRNKVEQLATKVGDISGSFTTFNLEGNYD